MVTAAAVVLVLVVASFALLLIAIVEMRDSNGLARHSRSELANAGRLQTLLIDMETGLRGFVITREEQFLEPWNRGRPAFAREAQALAAFADERGQAARMQAIARAGGSYIEDYGVPLIQAVRRDDPSASSVAVTAAGKRSVDAIREQFDAFTARERAILDARQDEADDDAVTATVAASFGLAASALLIVLFTAYLTRTIVRPVTRAATMAVRLAGGDLATRMPETGVDEIGALERSFSTMAVSLEESQGAQRRLLAEQASLRRVAALVAQGRPSDEVFAAVARELCTLLSADATYLGRYEPDHTFSALAGWSRDSGSIDVAAGSRLPGDDVTARVRMTGHAARAESHAGRHGGSAGCPIVVGGRVWGALVAVSEPAHTLPADVESRMTDFTELVATASSNADARAELSASRARIVTASDQTRRRIERDLHDGAQQRLVSLALELRAARPAVPPELDELGAELDRVVAGLEGALDENARWHEAFTPRSSQRAASARRLGRSRAGRLCRSCSSCRRTRGSPSESRWPRTSSCPRR